MEQIVEQKKDVVGLPHLDAIASQRVAENSFNRDTSRCQCCGGAAGSGDVWRMRWGYFYTPNRAIAFLAPILAVAGGGILVHTTEVWHETFHVICSDCAAVARRNRIISGILTYTGLFIAIIALGITMTGVTWWFIAGARDRALVERWIAVPVVALIGSAILTRFAIRFGVPRPMQPLLKWPFRSRGLARVTADSMV